MKYKHIHTAFVEALNKILVERLFKVQDAQELNDPEKVSSRWVKHLYGLVDELNDRETEMIGMKPKDAIKLKEVPLVNQEAYPPEEVLPEDGLYHYNPVKNMMNSDTEQRIGYCSILWESPLNIIVLGRTCTLGMDRRTQVKHGTVDKMHFITYILSLILKSRPDS